MGRYYNVGTECYALLTSPTVPEFLLPVQILILEKYTFNNKVSYKVKIRDIYETDFEYIKKNMSNLKLSSNLKVEVSNVKSSTLIKKSELDKLENKTELLNLLNDRPFFLEENYITLDKNGLKDLYGKFTKYLINYHYRKMFQLMSRSFLSTTPIFENQKNMFKKRVEKIGFGDMFDKFNFELEI